MGYHGNGCNIAPPTQLVVFLQISILLLCTVNPLILTTIIFNVSCSNDILTSINVNVFTLQQSTKYTILRSAVQYIHIDSAVP